MPSKKETQKIWHKFVKSSGVDEIGVFRYYLGKCPNMLTAEEYERVFTDLFGDLVATGALALPSLYQADDFVFVFSPGKLRRENEVEVRLKSKPKLNGAPLHIRPHYALTPHMKMKDIFRMGTLDKLAEAVA